MYYLSTVNVGGLGGNPLRHIIISVNGLTVTDDADYGSQVSRRPPGARGDQREPPGCSVQSADSGSACRRSPNGTTSRPR